MTISNLCVGFVVFIGLLVITGILGWLFMWVNDEESSCMIFFRLVYINHRFSNMSDLYFSYERFYLERCRKDERKM